MKVKKLRKKEHYLSFYTYSTKMKVQLEKKSFYTNNTSL